MNQTINKPWGQEIILTEKDLPYTAKILLVHAGKKLSLQSHDQKIETLTLISGQATISLGDNLKTIKEENMLLQSGYTINPGQIHRISATTNCQIFEASTPEQGTTKRLQDDYQRPDETPTLRNSPNRGWP